MEKTDIHSHAKNSDRLQFQYLDRLLLLVRQKRPISVFARTQRKGSAIGIDSCTNVTVTNLNIDAADPSVPEMRVLSRTDSTLTTSVVPPSRYSINPLGKLYWEGDGWQFTGGIAQLWGNGYTLRCASPMDRYRYVSTDSRGNLVWHYDAGQAPTTD